MPGGHGWRPGRTGLVSCEAECHTLFFGAPKSLQMVNVAMKLKDAYSVEGKL